MGSGEYGGNGSVHWHIHNEKDKAHGHGHRKHEGIDEFPTSIDGGNFTVKIFGIPNSPSSFSWKNGVLTATLPIKHGTEFTQQIVVTWPDPPGVLPSITTPDTSAAQEERGTAKAPYKT